MVIGVIGAGNMGSAIIRGLKESKTEQFDVCYTRKSSKADVRDRELTMLEAVKLTNNKELISKSDIVILAVKPTMAKAVLSEISSFWGENSKQLLVSIMAGVTLEELRKGLKKEKAHIVRAMPNTPVAIGEGVVSLSFNEGVTTGDIEAVKMIFKPLGIVSVVKESQIHAVIGISGSSPSYTYMYIEALADAGVKEGLTRKESYRMAAQAVLGAAKMVLETGEHPAVLKDQVASPAGTTIEAIASLEKNRFSGTVIEAVEACAKKSRSMEK